MQAKDILTATRKLEESGMNRSQSEAIASTIIAAVAPLATKDSLEHMATKTDIESINTRIESMKVWLMSGLLGVSGGMLAIAVSVAVYAFRIAA